MEDWNDPQTARNWSTNPVGHNPSRPEQLDILLSVLKEEYRQGETILDIGFGSGIIEEMIFKRIPGARVLGIDASEAMVALARDRLNAYQGQYDVLMHDLRDISTLRLPGQQIGVAISVQVIHNVEDEYKREVFAFVHHALKPGGLFLLLDRIAVDTPGLFSVYQAVWRRLDRLHGTATAEASAQNFEEMNARIRTRGDLPISLEQHLDWLRDAAFEPACLHLHGNRALFAARRANVE